MQEKKITVENIDKMSYIDLLSFIREENRPPGGKNTIREILKNSFLGPENKVLEVGCTNGFTSLEIARVVGCNVVGVDISEDSLKNARERITDENVKFINASAYNLPFSEGTFDLVFCGNATSFMDKKNDAVKEYLRVVKNWGFVALTPMYYIKTPPEDIINQVSKIIGTKIEITTKKEWISLLEENGFEIYYSKDYKFQKKTEQEIGEYSKLFIDKPFLRDLDIEVKTKIRDKWESIMKIFNENLSYVGYSIILLRKRSEGEERELFNEIVENG